MSLEGMILGVFAVVIIVVGVLTFAHRDDFSDACAVRGGHVRYVDTSGYKYANGKWGYVSDGFDECLTSDGRVIEL
jgi:hypothetical protein